MLFFFPVPEKKNSLLIWVSQCVSNFSRKKKNKTKKKQILEKKTAPKTTFSKIWEIDSMDYGKILTKVSWMTSEHRFFFSSPFSAPDFEAIIAFFVHFSVVFHKFIAFSLSLFSIKKTLLLFPIAPNFLYRLLYYRFFISYRF